MKTIINKNNVKQVQTKFKVNDGSLITDKFAISTKFNDFFVGVGPSLAKNIETQDISPQSYLGDRISSTIFLAPVSGEELVKLVNDLKNTAPGYDDLTADVLKLPIVHTGDALVYM